MMDIVDEAMAFAMASVGILALVIAYQIAVGGIELCK